MLVAAPPSIAQTAHYAISFAPTSPSTPHLHIDWGLTGEPVSPALTGPGRLFTSSALARAARDQQTTGQQPPAAPLHAAAIQHSEAYLLRAKIHKIASYATLPLFATELALGQSIYNSPTNLETKKSAHIIVGTGLIGLFGVNTLTGAWNLFGEGRQDKEGRTLRLVHGLLMMASDAGFVATSMTGPGGRSRRSANFENDKSLHRNLAVASISTGTIGYLLMLFGNR